MHFNRPAQRLIVSNLTLSDNSIGLALLPSCRDAPPARRQVSVLILVLGVKQS